MTEAPVVALHDILLTDSAITYLCELSGQFLPNGVSAIQFLVGDIARRCNQYALTAVELDAILRHWQLSVWLFSDPSTIYCERNLLEVERFLTFLLSDLEVRS